MSCTTNPSYELDPVTPSVPDYMHCASDSTYETCDPSNDPTDEGKNCNTVSNDPTVVCHCKTYLDKDDCLADHDGTEADRPESWCTSSQPDCGIQFIV